MSTRSTSDTIRYIPGGLLYMAKRVLSQRTLYNKAHRVTISQDDKHSSCYLNELGGHED